MYRTAALIALLALVAVPVLANDTTGITKSPQAVLDHLVESLSRWADKPFTGATCGHEPCCNTALGAVTEPQCKALAQAIRPNVEAAARRLIPLLVQDSAFDCHVFRVRGELWMACKTLPDPHPVGTSLDVFVARHASALALTQEVTP